MKSPQVNWHINSVVSSIYTILWIFEIENKERILNRVVGSSIPLSIVYPFPTTIVVWCCYVHEIVILMLLLYICVLLFLIRLCNSHILLKPMHLQYKLGTIILICDFWYYYCLICWIWGRIVIGMFLDFIHLRIK